MESVVISYFMGSAPVVFSFIVGNVDQRSNNYQRSTSQSQCPVDNLQFMYLMQTSSDLGSLALFVTKFKCKQDSDSEGFDKSRQ